VWLYVNGKWPEKQVDHINGNPLDNRFCNLREVDLRTNVENLRHARSDNRLGIQGVRKRSNRFEARIQVNGKAIHLGHFDSAKEAHSAYVKHKRKLHVGCTL
jgi:HNH endonuclease/AP2 domain